MIKQITDKVIHVVDAPNIGTLLTEVSDFNLKTIGCVSLMCCLESYNNDELQNYEFTSITGTDPDKVSERLGNMTTSIVTKDPMTLHENLLKEIVALSHTIRQSVSSMNIDSDTCDKFDELKSETFDPTYISDKVNNATVKLEHLVERVVDGTYNNNIPDVKQNVVDSSIVELEQALYDKLCLQSIGYYLDMVRDHIDETTRLMELVRPVIYTKDNYKANITGAQIAAHLLNSDTLCLKYLVNIGVILGKLNK